MIAWSTTEKSSPSVNVRTEGCGKSALAVFQVTILQNVQSGLKHMRGEPHTSGFSLHQKIVTAILTVIVLAFLFF